MEAVDEAFDALVAAAEAVVFDQILEDGLGIEAFAERDLDGNRGRARRHWRKGCGRDRQEGWSRGALRWPFCRAAGIPRRRAV